MVPAHCHTRGIGSASRSCESILLIIPAQHPGYCQHVICSSHLLPGRWHVGEMPGDSCDGKVQRCNVLIVLGSTSMFRQSLWHQNKARMTHMHRGKTIAQSASEMLRILCITPAEHRIQCLLSTTATLQNEQAALRHQAGPL